MGSQTFDSKGRLGPFLLKRVDCEKPQGLQWMRRNEKLFKIFWVDNRKTGRSGRAIERNPLFKDWARYNNRHKEGDEEDWPGWKQTFRNALRSCPEVKEVQEESDLENESMPFKAFRFSDQIKVVLSFNMNKPHAGNAYEEKRFCPNGKISTETQEYLKQNIPKVVTDELNNCDYAVAPMATNATNHKFQDENNSRMPSSDVMDTYVTQQRQRDDGCPNSYHQPFDSAFRMDSDEIALFCQGDPSMEIDSLPSFNFSTPESSLGNDDKSFVKFQVYYSDALVLEEFMNKRNGVRLFFGFKPDGDFPGVIGPKEFKQVELPDVKKFKNVLNLTDVKNISDIMDKMNRGLLLYLNDGKLFALRLCTSRVFAWNNLFGSIIVERKNKAEHLLFDMEHFKNKLSSHKSNPQIHFCPSPTVTLTLGQEYKCENPIKHYFVRVELTYLEAEELLQKEIPNDPQFSGLDSEDLLVKKFSEMHH